MFEAGVGVGHETDSFLSYCIISQLQCGEEKNVTIPVNWTLMEMYWMIIFPLDLTLHVYLPL